MIYGMYLSAAGLIADSYRQDVIANNLANADTTGFKKTLAIIQQRPTELQERGGPTTQSNPNLEKLGGGILASPTLIDQSQGDLEQTGNPLDLGIMGRGYFAVDDQGQKRLTRDGRFMLNSAGHLIMANGQGQAVLDEKGKPIVLDPRVPVVISKDGLISQNGKPVAQVGLFDVPDPGLMTKDGGNLLNYPDMGQLSASTARIESGTVERSNVDPAHALVELMMTQRQLEANANMIQAQDATLDKLVNEVGRIS